MELWLAADPNQISEQHYGTGSSIKFTRFDSCIGILATVGNKQSVVGIHLVLIPLGSDVVMSPRDVGIVGGVLTRHNFERKSLVIVGQIGQWAKDAGKTLEALSALRPDFDGTQHYQERDRGIISARLDKGHITIT